MYKIIQMEADYEPWWQFDDMEKDFVAIFEYENEGEYEENAVHILSQFEQKYDRFEQRDEKFFAFWNEGEFVYCEGCDEDLQKFYGIILSHPVKQHIK